MANEDALETLNKIYTQILQEKTEVEKAVQHARIREQTNWVLLSDVINNPSQFSSLEQHKQATASVRASLAGNQRMKLELQQKATVLAMMQSQLEGRARAHAQQRFAQEQAKQIEFLKARQAAQIEWNGLQRVHEDLVVQRNATLGRLRQIEDVVQRVLARKQQILETFGHIPDLSSPNAAEEMKAEPEEVPATDKPNADLIRAE